VTPGNLRLRTGAQRETHSLGLEPLVKLLVQAWIAQVGAAIVAVCVAQLFTGQPPSATIVDLLRPFERDILAVAKERAHGDPELADFFAARIAALAAVRTRRGADLPRDRRAWLRALARLAGDD
jgi:hypothetical protein